MKRIKVKTTAEHTDDKVISYFDQLLHRLGEKWKLFSIAAAAIVLAMTLGIVVNVVAENRDNEASDLLFEGIEKLGPLSATSPASFPEALTKLESEFAGKRSALIAQLYEGVYRYGKGEFNGAKMAFEEAVKGLEGDAPEIAAMAQYNLGLCHEALDQWSEANALYEKMAQQLAQSGFSQTLLTEARARAMNRSGDQDGAIRLLEEALANATEEQDRSVLTSALQAARLTFTEPLPQPEPEEAPADEVPAE